MRAKVFHARQLHWASSTSDRDPNNPPPDKQTRLVFYRHTGPTYPKAASAFPHSHPCYEAFRQTQS
jgi:hypothetical protein